MIRNIITLISGNAASQFVNVVTIVLVVTVFLSPSEFGRYAVLMSYVGILSAISSLRYELAIVSVRRRIAANNAIFASIIISLIFAVVVFAGVSTFAALFGTGFLLGVSPFTLTLLVLLRGLGQIFASTLYREEAYFNYSLLKLLQAVVLFAGFLHTGLSERGLGGLMSTTTVAYAVFAGGAIISTRRYAVSAGVRATRISTVVRRNLDFIKFNVPQVLVDNFLSNGMNFVLMVLAGPAIVGYYSYLHRILKAPLSLVFGAVAQVIFRFASKNPDQHDQVAKGLTRVYILVIVVLIGATGAVFMTYWEFDKIDFLRHWTGLHEYMLAFSAWMLVPFIFSPLSTLPIVYGKQKQFFFMATTFNLFSLTLIAVLVNSAGVNLAFWAVAALSLPYYVGLNLWLHRIVSRG